MTPSELDRVRHRLEEFFAYCFDGMGRSERRAALGTYLRGLLLDGERKCMMPMARRLTNDQSKVAATRQRIHEAVTAANWDEAELYRRLAIRVSKKLPGIEAFVLDDTGFAKKGKHSAGVHRQYSGTLGRVDNCQVATSLHLASESGGACIGAQLFLPQAWADAPERRKKAGIPDDIEHQPKWQIGLNLLDRALGWGIASHVVLADSGYGDCTAFRQALEDRHLAYVVGVSSGMSVWPPGVCPTPPPPREANAGVGRPKVRWTAPEGQLAVSLEILAETMPASYFRKVTWNKGRKSGRFAALRLRSAHKSTQGAAPGEEQWLLIEWAADKDKPRKFYLSNLPADTKLSRLVYLAKLRWRIERDYQEMKGELGLDHFEGRGWRGFHHHFACVAAAHAFLTLERVLFSPEDRSNHAAAV